MSPGARIPAALFALATAAHCHGLITGESDDPTVVWPPPSSDDWSIGEQYRILRSSDRWYYFLCSTLDAILNFQITYRLTLKAIQSWPKSNRFACSVHNHLVMIWYIITEWLQIGFGYQ